MCARKRPPVQRTDKHPPRSRNARKGARKRMRNPCNGCTGRRHAECHAKCQDYAAWRQEHEELKKAEHLRNDVPELCARSRKKWYARMKQRNCR